MTIRRHDPPPLRTDDRRIIAVGTAVWIAVLVGLLIWRGDVRRAGLLWWFPMCLCGVAFGLLGLVYLRVRPGQLARRQARHDAAQSAKATAPEG